VELDIARTVRPEPEDTDAGPDDRIGERIGQLDGTHGSVLRAKRHDDRADVDAVGRPEQFLVVDGQTHVGRVRGRLRRKERIPPPS